MPFMTMQEKRKEWIAVKDQWYYKRGFLILEDTYYNGRQVLREISPRKTK